MNGKQGGENGSPGGKSSLEERLRAARGRHGLDATPSAGNRSPGSFGGSALGIGLRVGVELVSALVVAVGIGWALDHWLHTMPLFLIVFLFLGGAAGVLNVWRIFAPSQTPPGRADKAGDSSPK